MVPNPNSNSKGTKKTNDIGLYLKGTNDLKNYKILNQCKLGNIPKKLIIKFAKKPLKFKSHSNIKFKDQNSYLLVFTINIIVVISSKK